MKKCFIIFSLVFLFHISISAQALTSSTSSSEILQSLYKLNTLGSVLYIAAHPDDENTRLLTYLAQERKYRTAYLSLTRGDGGQNLIGSEQGDLLGLIRTEELLAARRTDGAEQWFTRAVDFGYSKNPDETFRFWNKDSVLADVVFAIRKFRPDVIICRFPTTGEGGHGHHTASAILAQEAFDLAGDPTKYPEQLQYVSVWQAKRLFWNTFNFGTTNTTAPDQITLDVGGYNTLLGKSYGEIAASSRSCHKSQGFGSASQRGSQLEYFKLIKGDSVKKDIFEGINTTWTRVQNGKKMGAKIQECINKFSYTHPEKSIQYLMVIAKLSFPLYADKDHWWIHLKLTELQNVILQASGLWIETTVSDYRLIPGTEVVVTTRVLMRNPSKITLNNIQFTGMFDTIVEHKLKHNEMYTYTKKVIVPKDSKYSSPHWLGNKNYLQQNSIPQVMNQLFAMHSFTFEGFISPLAFNNDLKYKYTDPVKGEIYRPLEILPPATLTANTSLIVSSNAETKKVYFLVKAHTDNVRGTLVVTSDKSCYSEVVNPEFSLLKKGDEVLIEVKVNIMNPNYEGFLNASVLINGIQYAYSMQRIEYDHIPSRFVLNESRVKLLRFDLKTSGKLIGYIPGAGDAVAASLEQIGYTVVTLSDEMVKNSDLTVYDAIVTGIRAYNTNSNLALYNKQLMHYVEKGGRFIVQYNTNSRVGPVQSNIGPYKFTISRNRVTDEEAQVKFINDTSALLKFPNRITKDDFNGWVQERGIYYAIETDSMFRYEFAMQDPGEKDQYGSLIWAPYGKGVFIYTGLAFFRQLPAGVPGAYRLFVNILSMPVQKP